MQTLIKRLKAIKIDGFSLNDRIYFGELIKHVEEFDFVGACCCTFYSHMRNDYQEEIKKYKLDPIELERYRISVCEEQIKECEELASKLIKQTVASREIINNMIMPDLLRQALMRLDPVDDTMIYIKEFARKGEWTYQDKKDMSDKISGLHEIPEIYALATWCHRTPSQIVADINYDDKLAADHEEKARFHRKIAEDNRMALAYIACSPLDNSNNAEEK